MASVVQKSIFVCNIRGQVTNKLGYLMILRYIEFHGTTEPHSNHLGPCSTYWHGSCVQCIRQHCAVTHFAPKAKQLCL